MVDRAALSKAWSEGYNAGREGKTRAVNPYVGRIVALAKEWDLGWCEGNNS